MGNKMMHNIKKCHVHEKTRKACTFVSVNYYFRKQKDQVKITHVKACFRLNILHGICSTI